MSSITKQVNGIVATITPAIFQTLGPSGQQIEFTSQSGTGASSPITITFDKPITSFALTLVGLSFNPHTTRLYNTNGVLIRTITNNVSQLDNGSGGGIQNILWNTSVDDGSAIRVELLPPSADYIGYRNLTVEPIVQITPTNPIPQPNPTVPPPIVSTPVTPPQQTPPPPTVAPVRYINLADVVVLDALVIDRQYIKGSLRNIAPAKFNVRNISSEVEVQVALSGLAGVSFDPANFTLAKNGTQEVTTNFDVTTIDTLPEGINTVNAAINLNSNTAVFDPLPPPPAPIPPLPPTPLPAPQPAPIPQLPPPVVAVLPPPSTAEIPQVNFARQTVYAPLVPLPPNGTPLTNPSQWTLYTVRQAEYFQALSDFNTAVANGAEIIPRPDGRTSLGWREANIDTSEDLIRGTTLFTPQVPNPPVLISQPQTPIVPPGDPSLNLPLPPVEVTTAPSPVLTPWVNGTSTGGLSYGSPPDGWVQDPFGGAWYPPTDPFVLRDFDRAARSGYTTTTTETFNTPILLAPEVLPPPPPPPPAPPPPYVPPEETFFSGGSSTNNVFYDDGSTGIRNLQDEFLF